MSTIVKVRTLKQAVAIQGIAYRSALAVGDIPAESLEDASTRAKALQALAMVWDTARDAARVARGRPLPGSLRPTAKPKRKPKATGHVEPTGPAPAPQEPGPPAQPG